MAYSIIIPSRNPGNLRECLRAIALHGDLKKVIVVDDSDDGDRRVEILCATHHLPRIIGIKPFIFARNVNLGIWGRNGWKDVILLNDDALLQTPGGFDRIEHLAETFEPYGILSAAISGFAGNPEQAPSSHGLDVRTANNPTLCFICVYIRRGVIYKVGILDDRFVNYGADDDDYCKRVRDAGYKLGIVDGCVIEHGTLPSTFRQAGNMPSLEPNRKIFNEKWGIKP